MQGYRSSISIYPQEDEKLMKQICIVKRLNNIFKELIEDKNSKERGNLIFKCYID